MISRRTQLRHLVPPSAGGPSGHRGAGSGAVFPMARRPRGEAKEKTASSLAGGVQPGLCSGLSTWLRSWLGSWAVCSWGRAISPAFLCRAGRLALGGPARLPQKKSAPLSSSASCAVGCGAGACDPPPPPRPQKSICDTKNARRKRAGTARPSTLLGRLNCAATDA